MRPYTQPYSATVAKLGGILALPVRGSDEIVRAAIISNGATVRALDHPGDTASIDWMDEDFDRDEGEI